MRSSAGGSPSRPPAIRRPTRLSGAGRSETPWTEPPAPDRPGSRRPPPGTVPPTAIPRPPTARPPGREEPNSSRHPDRIAFHPIATAAIETDDHRIVLRPLVDQLHRFLGRLDRLLVDLGHDVVEPAERCERTFRVDADDHRPPDRGRKLIPQG